MHVCMCVRVCIMRVHFNWQNELLLFCLCVRILGPLLQCASLGWESARAALMFNSDAARNTHICPKLNVRARMLPPHKNTRIHIYCIADGWTINTQRETHKHSWYKNGTMLTRTRLAALAVCCLLWACSAIPPDSGAEGLEQCHFTHESMRTDNWISSARRDLRDLIRLPTVCALLKNQCAVAH